MKKVCVIDLDETLGKFTNSSEFIVRPYAYNLLDFLRIAKMELILWSYGSDLYVEHVINTHFDIFSKFNNKTRVYGRTVCETSKRKYGFLKHSQVIRKLYLDNILLIGIDDRANINMDEGYDFRILVEPYNEKNKYDNELIQVMFKIMEYLKEEEDKEEM